MSDVPAPMSPLAFREACVAFLIHWEEVGEPGEEIDDAVALEWFLDHYGHLPIDVGATTVRFLETMDALEEPPLCEFVQSDDEDHEILHTAIFESAALAPMSEAGKLDVAWIAQDLGRRLHEIETFERLVGGP